MAVRIVRYKAAEPKESKVRLVRRENAIRQNNTPLRNPVPTAAPRSAYTKPKSNGYVSVADLNRATNGSGVTPAAVTSPAVRAAVNRSRRNGGRAIGTDTHSKLLKTAMEKNQRESEKQARANERRGLLPRVGDTLLGGLKQRGGSMTNAAGTVSDLVGGTAMNTVYRDQTEMLDRQIAALNDVLSDPALPERERVETRDALRAAKNRRGLYGDALRANKGTAQKLYEAADALTRSGAWDMERAKAGLSGAERVGIDVLTQGEQLLLDKALGGVTGLGALTHMAARSFGSGAQQARQEGASPQRAALYGAADAIKETATEKLFDGLGGVYGKGAADKAAQKAIKRLSNSEATERLLRVAASALEEGGEELLGGVTAPPLQSLYNGKSVAQNYRDMKPGDVLYDALIGGILGAAGGSADVTRDAVRTNLPRNMTREIPLRTAPRDGRMETREIKTEVVRNGDQQGDGGQVQPGERGTLAQDERRPRIQSEVRGNKPKTGPILRFWDETKGKVSRRATEYKTAATFDSAEEWTHKAPAYTDRNGNVHFSSEIPAEYITEALEHELNHVMKRKRYQP